MNVMNRRKAIGSLFLMAGAGLASYAGLRFYKLYKTPELGLLQSHKVLIDELAETIIPRTNTPGAKDAQVGDFIATMIRDCTSKKEQNTFLYGLHDVQSYSRHHFDRPFEQCDEHARNAVLTYFEQRDQPTAGIVGKVSRKVLGDPFFAILKKYTLLGYCTSEPGATQQLAYDYVPGAYHGCRDLQPGQKCWITE